MVKLLDPKNDVVFQKLFGMKKNKHILISFLNSILNLTGENSIKDVEFEEKHLDVSLISSEKLSILDLHVTTETGVNINVEIQLINQYNMIKRTIFYMSKMILSQLKKGEDYSNLNRTVNINILNFNYLEGENYINNYALFEKETKLILTDLLEIVFIELPKFNRLRVIDEHTDRNKEYNDKLHKWLTFLSNPMGKEIEEFMKNDGEIKEAMDIFISREPKSMIWCESLTQRTNVSRVSLLRDKKAVMLAEMREKAIMDEQSRLKGAREEGLKEGLDKGRTNGLKEGLDKGKKDGLKETIIDNLKELGDVPQNLIDIINKQDDMSVLKFWNKIAVICESIGEFSKKIK